MASKAKKKKGGWTAADWGPLAGKGTVVRGFCQTHGTFWCPCAAPSLYGLAPKPCSEIEMRMAEQSGICPFCSKFINKNQSMVVRLDPPVVPRTSDDRRSDDDGGYYYGDGRKIELFPRRWCHERCWRSGRS